MHPLNPHDFDGDRCRCGEPVPKTAPSCPLCDDLICTACSGKTRVSYLAYEPAHAWCEEKRNDAAYESSLSDYYGSSAPQTDRERAEVALMVKR